MGKTYRVVLNSNIAGGSNSNQRFFYDWSKLEQGKYKCSFTMVCAFQSNPDLVVTPAVFLDLGQSNTYIARGTNTRTTPWFPSYIGCLGCNSLEDGATIQPYAFADLEDNPPFYLQQRPPNNTMTVNIYIATLGGFPSLYNPPLIGRYTLTLYLEKMD